MPRFMKTKPLWGSLCASLIVSLCLTPLSAQALDIEQNAVTAASKAETLHSQTTIPVQNAASTVEKTTTLATRKSAGVYDKVLDYQKSKRPIGNQLKATLSPNKIPGVTKAKRTAAVMSIPAILLIFTFIISLFALGRSGAYERN